MIAAEPEFCNVLERDILSDFSGFDVAMVINDRKIFGGIEADVLSGEYVVESGWFLAIF